MPAPTSALTSLRPDLASSLEKFDLEANRLGFIARDVLPVMNVGESTGQFGVIPIEQLLRNEDTLRASKSNYKRGSWTFTNDTYDTDEYGWEEPVDHREEKLYGNFFDAELISAKRAQAILLGHAERRAAALIFNTTTWTGSSLTTGVGTPWTTYASATPVTDVEGAVAKVRAGSGMIPNALIITWKAYRALRQCAQIRDLVSSSGAGDPETAKLITPQKLAEVFDLDRVIVAGATQNTAKEGQNASLSSIWDDTKAMVARIEDNEDIQTPTLGKTFHWSADGSEVEGLVESYESNSNRSTIIRVRHDVQEKVLYKELGHLLTAVTA